MPHSPSVPHLCPLQAGGKEQKNGGIDLEPEQKEGFVTATFDLDECRMNRAGWVPHPAHSHALACGLACDFIELR